MTRPVALIILDGWGIRTECTANAVCQAHTPRLDELAAAYPWTRLNASGLSVGLPDGQMGNSEVGHMTLGAGRIMDMDIVRIKKPIDAGELAGLPAIQQVLEAAKRAGRALHLMGREKWPDRWRCATERSASSRTGSWSPPR